MISAEHVAELVLVAELHVPVGVPEKSIGAIARPPGLLEVVVQVRVPTDECSPHARPNGLPRMPVDGAGIVRCTPHGPGCGPRRAYVRDAVRRRLCAHAPR